MWSEEHFSTEMKISDRTSFAIDGPGEFLYNFNISELLILGF